MKTFTITAGTEVRTNVSEADLWTVSEELFKLTGKVPVPVVTGMQQEEVKVEPKTEAPAPKAEAPAPKAEPIGAQEDGIVCSVGKARTEADANLAANNGFSLRQPLYDRGTVVNSVGVENARKARQEWENMPTTQSACRDFVSRIVAEDRKDICVSLKDIRMDNAGRIGRGGRGFTLSENSFQQLVGRQSAALKTAGLDSLGGAGSYLRACPPQLRAVNVNHWGSQLSEIACEDQIMIRNRKGQDGKREVYAILSDRYTPFDADQVCESIMEAVPADARGTVTYDGIKTRVECLFHSTVKPEHYVAGEVFRAGVIVTTDDTGGGAVNASAVVYQNLCRNLIIVDKAQQEVCNLRHIGEQHRIVRAFRQGFREAVKKVEAFANQWDRACEDVIKPVTGQELREELIRAAIHSLIQRELVPVSGRKPEAERQVFQAWQKDNSGAGLAHGGLNRAALANAFTRYAHEGQHNNPWMEDEIQQAAGRLVWGQGAYRDMIV